MTQPQICQKCRLPYETTRETGILKCPLCGDLKISAPPLPVAELPRCGLCNRRTKPQGEFFVCPHCNVIVDGLDEKITGACDDPTRRLELQERAKHKPGGRPAALARTGTHRGGDFKRYVYKPRFPG